MVKVVEKIQQMKNLHEELANSDAKQLEENINVLTAERMNVKRSFAQMEVILKKIEEDVRITKETIQSMHRKHTNNNGSGENKDISAHVSRLVKFEESHQHFKKLKGAFQKKKEQIDIARYFPVFSSGCVDPAFGKFNVFSVPACVLTPFVCLDSILSHSF
jgi:hypothetical protein